MNMDYQEGYCDGLAGAGMQDRGATCQQDECTCDEYFAGFEDVSLDRKAMLQWREANEAGEA